MGSGSGERPEGVPGPGEGTAKTSGLVGGSRDLEWSGVVFRDLRQREGAVHLRKHIPLTCTPQSCPEAKRNRRRLSGGVGTAPESLGGCKGHTWAPHPLPPLCRNKTTQHRKIGGSSKAHTDPKQHPCPPQGLTQGPPRTGH